MVIQNWSPNFGFDFSWFQLFVTVTMGRWSCLDIQLLRISKCIKDLNAAQNEGGSFDTQFSYRCPVCLSFRFCFMVWLERKKDAFLLVSLWVSFDLTLTSFIVLDLSVPNRIHHTRVLDLPVLGFFVPYPHQTWLNGTKWSVLTNASSIIYCICSNGASVHGASVPVSTPIWDACISLGLCLVLSFSALLQQRK